MDSNVIHNGNALDVLKTFPDNSIDGMVTDPPYGYQFMNKEWDKAVIGVDTWKECLRVLKPGSFACIMSSPRQDVLCKMTLNLIDAGFRTDFTSIYWTYASGFPKAANVSKLITKRNNNSNNNNQLDGSYAGFQPKPAIEVILMVMKPLKEKTFVDQALSNGKGVTWLDDGRIPYQSEQDYMENWSKDKNSYGDIFGNCNAREKGIVRQTDNRGRFPANLLVSDNVLNDGRITKSPNSYIRNVKSRNQNAYGKNIGDNVGKLSINYGDSGSYSRYFDLDRWFETTFPFIITPKASKSERNMGLDKWIEPQKVNDGRQTPIDNPFQRGETLRVNTHPTVKPIKLMSYLIHLISRPSDIILDPFLGSGTTAISCKMLNRRYVGIELNRDYVNIAKQRLKSLETSKNLTINTLEGL